MIKVPSRAQQFYFSLPYKDNWCVSTANFGSSRKSGREIRNKRNFDLESNKGDDA